MLPTILAIFAIASPTSVTIWDGGPGLCTPDEGPAYYALELLTTRNIPGTGVARATVAAVLPALATKEFRSKDAFVAYCGLDLKVADSGQKKGRRRISKNGDPHIRRALYMAAMAASRTKAWNPLYLRFKERLTGVAALNALARAIARTLYGMHKTQTAFNPELCLLDNRT